MTILKVHFATGQPFLEHYLAELPNGGLFFPTRRALAIGEAVVVSIRLGKRGAAGHNGGPPGDLFVVVRVDAHELFGRRGKDLTLSVPVTFPEATLGATIKVPTLDGPVTLKVPAGTKTGRTFRVKGRGVPASSGAGDLLVTVEVAVPAQLSDTQREAVEALGDVLTDSPRRHLGV